MSDEDFSRGKLIRQIDILDISRASHSKNPNVIFYVFEVDTNFIVSVFIHHAVNAGRIFFDDFLRKAGYKPARLFSSS